MKIVGGKLVLGTCQCYCGDGKVTPSLPCKLDGKRQRGKPCAICGSKTKHHNYVKQAERTCERCNGTAIIPETRFDYLPKEEWEKLEFKVIRQDRRQGIIEQTLGFGVYSCGDYGAAWQKNDDEALIAEVRASGSHQACKVVDENGKVCDFVGIYVARNGYSVCGVFSGVPHTI